MAPLEGPYLDLGEGAGGILAADELTAVLRVGVVVVVMLEDANDGLAGELVQAHHLHEVEAVRGGVGRADRGARPCGIIATLACGP